jgi:hypothetical protein
MVTEVELSYKKLSRCRGWFVKGENKKGSLSKVYRWMQMNPDIITRDLPSHARIPMLLTPVHPTDQINPSFIPTSQAESPSIHPSIVERGKQPQERRKT